MKKEHRTSKQKLDEVLGITDGSSIDEFLDGLSLDTNELSGTFSNIDAAVKSNIDDIDVKLNEVQNNDNTSVELILKDINTSMKEVEDLIQIAKNMFKHVYEAVITTDLVDSELVGAASKLLEGIHINIAEFISMYRDKQRYVDRIKLMVFQQEQKKELMLLKHKLDLEKMQQTGNSNTTDVENMVSYSQEEITKMLNDSEMNSL